MSEIRVITNSIPRPVIDASELTYDERDEFNYICWPCIEEGKDSASFFRYKGQLYDLGEFTADIGILKGSSLPDYLSNWDGYMSEHAFSAIVIRMSGDDSVIVGRVLS
jgi:hypothetical protein